MDQSPFPYGEPVEEDVEPTEERESSKSGSSPEAPVATQELLAPLENPPSDSPAMIPPLEEEPSPGNPEEDVKPPSDEPFMEWFEPIEDDEDDDGDEGDEDDDDAATSLDKNEQDEESLGEESESMTESEKTTKKISMYVEFLMS